MLFANRLSLFGDALSESTEGKETPESTEDIIRRALTEDESYILPQTKEGGASGDTGFSENDDKFLRVARYVFQQTIFGNYGSFCEQVYRISFVKLKMDCTQTYPPDAYIGDTDKSLADCKRGHAIRSGDGYPFHPFGSGSGATHRIYLSPAPEYATAVYRYVLELSKADDQIKWSKLSDYEILTKCRDPLVIYVSGDDTLEKMRAALQEYQQGNAHHFLKEIPVMTAPLTNLLGVGYAEDLGYLRAGNEVLKYFTDQTDDWQANHDWVHPDDRTGIVNLSHSQWRGVFIFTALRKSGHGGMDDLRKSLATIAGAAGLTPATMHKRPQITSELVGLIAEVLFPEKGPGTDQ
jgi:hypothetical protein